MTELGLIGKSLGHSFSRQYFKEKFHRESISGYHYRNYELSDIRDFPKLMADQPNLAGLNVTVPYKSVVIPYLDTLSDAARQIGAVNTIRIHNGKKEGFNTDHIGFTQSLSPLLQKQHKRALILGSGGASKAVQYVLNKLAIAYKVVSTKPNSEQLSYLEAGEQMRDYHLVVNCTPLGTTPALYEMPPLSLENVSEIHLFYDLIYNPEKSHLLTEAEKRGARIKNGYEMLVLQAEAAWQIWQMD